MSDNSSTTQWVILEAMGHKVVAGRYFFENGLHRVDIPDVSPDAGPADFVRTECYGTAGIYCITTVIEEAARLMAQKCQIPEAIPWDIRRELKQLAGPAEPIEVAPFDDDPFDDDDDGDDLDLEDWHAD